MGTILFVPGWLYGKRRPRLSQGMFDSTAAGCMGSAARDCLRIYLIPQRLAVWVDPSAIDPSVDAQANRSEPMPMLPWAVPLKNHIMTRSDPAAHRAVGAKKICRNPTKNVLSRLLWIACLTASLPTAPALIPKRRPEWGLNSQVRPEDPPPPHL